MNFQNFEAKKKSSTSAGLEPTTSGFERPLLYRLNYEARREQVVGDYWWQLRQCDCTKVMMYIIFSDKNISGNYQ